MMNFKLLFILLFFPFFALAETPIINEATQHLLDEDYPKSLELYEAALLDHSTDPYLYFNIAYAASKSNELAKAVYYYRKALRLKPNFVEARTNLKLIEPKINQATNQETNTILQVGFIGTPALIWFCAAQLSILVLVLLLMSANRSSSGATPIGGRLLASTFTVILFCSAYFLHQHLRTENIDAVMMKPDVVLRAGPGPNYLESQTLPEGATIRFLGRPVSGWIKGQTAEGIVGYLPIDSLRAL